MNALLKDLVALVKPGITAMAVFMAAGCLYIAPEEVHPFRAFLALAGIGLLVGSANTFNQVLERRADGLMERTRDRPLPARRLQRRTAVFVGVGLGLTAFALLREATNPLTCWLGLAALVVYVFVYTPLKYRTTAALLIGAIPGAMPALLGWTAATGEVQPFGMALFLVLFIWQVPHFLAISLFRRHEYGRAGIHVVPLTRGEDAARRETLAYTLALVPVSLALVPLGAGLAYGVVALVAGGWLTVLAASPPRRGIEAWGRRYFRATLAYLPLLVAGLAVDAAIA